MKAAFITETGAPEVLHIQEVTEPEITQTTEVKIRIHAAGVNPIDTKVRQNGLFYPDPFPAILGCDGAGEVVAVGNEVTRFKKADQVWFCHGGLGQEAGNYAEFTVIEQRWLAKKPGSITYVEAAASPLVLITAYGALFSRGGLKAGQTVLIHAGAGGVGHVAIQLAKIAGATVITTVSDQAKQAFVETLGADHAIRYQDQDIVEQTLQLTNGQGADLIFDTVGEPVFNQSIKACAHFGTLVTLLDPGEYDLAEARMRNLTIAFELMLTPMLRQLSEQRDQHVNILNKCTKWMQEGKLKTHIQQQLPLNQVAEAHSLIEQGHSYGKLVIIP